MLITIDRYPVFIKLGHFPHERVLGQEVLVSLGVELDEALLADMHDNLDDTLDYGALIAKIDQELGDKEIKLIETAVLRLGRRLLETLPAIAAVEVTIEKPVLPQGMNKGAKVSVHHRFSRI
jgi:dihydroneopterin aldolase